MSDRLLNIVQYSCLGVLHDLRAPAAGGRPEPECALLSRPTGRLRASGTCQAQGSSWEGKSPDESSLSFSGRRRGPAWPRPAGWTHECPGAAQQRITTECVRTTETQSHSSSHVWSSRLKSRCGRAELPPGAPASRASPPSLPPSSHDLLLCVCAS